MSKYPEVYLIDGALRGFTGYARLYKVRTSYFNSHYIVVSAANVPFSGPETYVFSADEDGNVTDWEERAGSFRGDLNQDRALGGYIRSLKG